MVIHKNPEARIDAELRMAQCHGVESTGTPLTVTEGVEKALLVTIPGNGPSITLSYLIKIKTNSYRGTVTILLFLFFFPFFFIRKRRTARIHLSDVIVCSDGKALSYPSVAGDPNFLSLVRPRKLKSFAWRVRFHCKSSSTRDTASSE